MAIHLSPNDLAATEQIVSADFDSASDTRRWSPAWIFAVVLVTIVVDVFAVWGVLAVLGPIGLLTFAVLAVAGLYLVATRPSTTSFS